MKCVAEHQLFEIPTALRPFAFDDHMITEDELVMHEEEVSIGTSPSSLEAWRALLETPYNQILPFSEYVNDLGPFGTHQGVKGLEFDRVLVILDDDSDARGFLFSYDKLFEAKPLSVTDRKHISDATDGGIARTLRLLYVTCIRAKKVWLWLHTLKMLML